VNVNAIEIVVKSALPISIEKVPIINDPHKIGGDTVEKLLSKSMVVSVDDISFSLNLDVRHTTVI